MLSAGANDSIHLLISCFSFHFKLSSQNPGIAVDGYPLHGLKPYQCAYVILFILQELFYDLEINIEVSTHNL